MPLCFHLSAALLSVISPIGAHTRQRGRFSALHTFWHSNPTVHALTAIAPHLCYWLTIVVTLVSTRLQSCPSLSAQFAVRVVPLCHGHTVVVTQRCRCLSMLGIYPRCNEQRTLSVIRRNHSQISQIASNG